MEEAGGSSCNDSSLWFKNASPHSHFFFDKKPAGRLKSQKDVCLCLYECVCVCVFVHKHDSFLSEKGRALKKLIYKITPWTLLLHFHSPDIWVGDHLFVKEQTADSRQNMLRRDGGRSGGGRGWR